MIYECDSKSCITHTEGHKKVNKTKQHHKMFLFLLRTLDGAEPKKLSLSLSLSLSLLLSLTLSLSLYPLVSLFFSL